MGNNIAKSELSSVILAVVTILVILLIHAVTTGLSLYCHPYRPHHRYCRAGFMGIVDFSQLLASLIHIPTPFSSENRF